ncbi:hypothetical protein MNBD_GAMMA12-1929 [hydrothermal vent metagenome]|uniref:S1 motif domain-containing protein n=1 Tax=hydrothermal vent metagenome TaxID=652676 RepID=A0A3B0YQB1_9ZZZZ
MNIPEIDWYERIPDAREFTQIGDKFMVNVGDFVIAEVTRVEVWGVFLVSDSCELFMNIPEIDWYERIPDAREFTQIGDKFYVKVLAFNPKKNQFGVSAKEARSDLNPWSRTGTLEIGKIFSVKVTKSVEYGAFVSLFPGIECLVKLEDGGRGLHVGERVAVVVIETELERKKVCLRVI